MTADSPIQFVEQASERTARRRRTPRATAESLVRDPALDVVVRSSSQRSSQRVGPRWTNTTARKLQHLTEQRHGAGADAHGRHERSL